MDRIKIITIEGCGQCKMIAEILNKKGLEYETKCLRREEADKGVDYPIVNYRGHVFDYSGFLRFIRENKIHG